MLLRQLNATEADAQLYGHLASSVIYANPSLRADASLLGKNRRGQSGLWGYSISGDLPIVLLQIGDPANIELVRQLVQAHAYWRLKGLAVDLVIWNEDHAGYRQLLQEQIMGLIAAGLEANVHGSAGRHLRAARRSRYRTRTAFCSRRSPAPSSPTAGGRCGTRSTVAGSRKCPSRASARPGPAAPKPRRRPRRLRAT